MAAALDTFREGLRRQVAADGLDAHQTAANELAWAVARSEAAAALEAWAGETSDSSALQIAAAARRNADAAVVGCDLGQVTAEAELLAQIAKGYRPLEDIGADPEQRLLRETVRDFADRVVRPRAQDVHRQNLDVPEEVIAGAARLGFFGLSIPAELGGTQDQQSDYRSMLIVTEELSRASLGAGGSLITRPEILVRALLRGGTEEQKRRWLPDIASGARLVAVAVTEPDAGSDVAAVRCRAHAQPDGSWLINGAKLWCTFAGRAELLMVLCRTADTGHRGLSVFVLEKPAFTGHDFVHRQERGGVLRGRAIPTIGYRGMHTYELAFENYSAPPASLLGGDEWLHRGFYLQMESFATGRLQTAGRAVGVMQAALEAAFAYAGQRNVFGKPLVEQQLAQTTLGRMAVQTAAARQLSYRAARLIDQGEGQMEASLAKLYASRAAESVTRDAMQLHGGLGYGEETDVSRYFVDARVLAIFEGAEEVLALRVVARALLES